MSYMSKQSFIKGTMILLAAGIINRILGFVPRIMLPRFIGAEGVGLYQMGYPFLIVLITIVTGGLPLAIAKLVAEAESTNNHRRVRNILTVALLFVIVISSVFTLFSLWAAPWVTKHLLTDDRVYYTFLTMSPIIIFIGISSVFRGYFQGKQNMIPTALSQIIETIVRSIAMLALAFYLLPFGVEYAAAGAMGGMLIGEIVGLLVLLFHFKMRRSKRQQQGEALQNLRRLLSISIPVTASKLVGSVSYFLESIMIVQSLAFAGIATHVATAHYGALTGMVIPILLIPGALTYSLAISLVPALSEAAAKKEMGTIHLRLHQSLKICLVAGAPFAIIMFVLAEPLCQVLFNDASIAPMLKMMAPAALFMYFQAPLQATLQALDRPNTALLNTFIGAALKLVLIFVLAAYFKMGIIGAVIAMSINIILVTILHGRSVIRLLGFKLNTIDFIKVGCAMLFMAVASTFVIAEMEMSSLLLHFSTALLAGTIVYFIAIVWLKLINRHDFIRIPWFGKKMSKWL